MLGLSNKILGAVSLNLGIDLGTANTLVSVQNQGIISEPSVVAINKNTNEVLMGGNAVGNKAKKMIGKTPPNIQAVRPLKHGVISDFAVTEAMLRYFIRKALNFKWGIRVRVVIAIPSGINSVEKQAVIDSTRRAGAKEVYLIDEPMAAAIGSGLPITEAKGSMIVDIGGGTSEVAIISLASPVVTRGIKIAGDAMDRAIVDYLKQEKKILIGESTAEIIKKNLGSACELEQELQMEIKGQHATSSLPRTVIVRSEEVREAIQTCIQDIIHMIKGSLEATSPEISADLIERGIVLAGGGALLKGLDQVIANETQLKVSVADSPLECVVRGTGAVLGKLDLLQHILSSP